MTEGIGWAIVWNRTVQDDQDQPAFRYAVSLARFGLSDELVIVMHIGHFGGMVLNRCPDALKKMPLPIFLSRPRT